TRGAIRRLKAAGDLPVRAGETQMLAAPAGIGAARLLVVGLGKRREFRQRGWRKAVSVALAAVLKTRCAHLLLAIDQPDSEAVDAYYIGRAVAELTGTALYRINDFKTGARPPRRQLQRVSVAGVAAREHAAALRGLAHGEAIGAGQDLLRDLGNLPGNVCTPRYLAAQAKQLAKVQRSVRVKVFDEAQIRRLKMGCLLAVARGSAEPPRFIVLEYRGGARAAAPIVLVGKGVTFDSGGISLKDPPAMDEMKYDMCGAGSVLAALLVVARLKLRLNVVGLIPTVENMPGSRAVKPGDIATSAAGKTVEILNTDAEGRLILCDALHYARRYEPAAVVDMATLTGACIIALGHHFTGIMGNDDALAQELVAAGARAADRGWQLPLTEDYAEQLRSNFADLANVAGRDGGAITAAAFLSRFTQGLKWAHLDIAGTAWTSGAQKGGTGRPVPLLADFLIHRAGAARS
ncbi:MAG TPA: leucyl aminopeptidase, partial [Steroidobacteraceae bacterium]|nr:leucyl aminopeptidase [Steroidobacteraceae bacterium]